MKVFKIFPHFFRLHKKVKNIAQHDYQIIAQPATCQHKTAKCNRQHVSPKQPSANQILLFYRLWNYSAFIFFLLSISAGMLWGAIDTFFFVFLNETLGASLTLIGKYKGIESLPQTQIF